MLLEDDVFEPQPRPESALSGVRRRRIVRMMPESRLPKVGSVVLICVLAIVASCILVSGYSSDRPLLQALLVALILIDSVIVAWLIYKYVGCFCFHRELKVRRVLNDVGNVDEYIDIDV